jgi:hypothetical protein
LCFYSNKFDFTHIKPFDRSFIKKPGPMVVFATPGMLHAGLSLECFKAWGSDEKNLVIMPGYCVAGTVGNKVLAGQKTVNEYKTSHFYYQPLFLFVLFCVLIILFFLCLLFGFVFRLKLINIQQWKFDVKL